MSTINKRQNSVFCPQNATSSPTTGTSIKAPTFASPLEKFLESQKQKLRCLEEDERKIVERINVFQVKKNTSLTANIGPTCSNCHRQECHNRLNCPYFACDTLFHCGAINRHPDEKAQHVENWFQLNKDAKKLEIFLKGKLPRPQSDIQGLLSQAQIDNSSRINKSSKTSVRNPYKKLRQDRGVEWPKNSIHSLTAASEDAIN
jgi:hypothetical protein